MNDFKGKFTYDTITWAGLVGTFTNVTLSVDLGTAHAGDKFSAGIWDVLADTLTLQVASGETVPITVSL